MTNEYDVVIIGGGIHGAACAAALTRRGYRLLLLEQSDFAAGATAASSKLIHGGLRYLESGNARLVHHALQARERLLRERPHLVQPLPFLLPVYRGDRRPAPLIRASLVLYDLLSPRKVAPWHRAYSRAALRRLEPAVRMDDLQAAYLYHDAQVVMPERLCLEYLGEARAAGADLRNYSAVDFVVVSGGVARGVDFHAVASGERHSVSARVIINAAGPWVDTVLEATGQRMDRRLGSVKGSHLVLDLEGRGPQHAILAEARADRRHIVIAPWLGHHLIGTTDVRFASDPRDAQIEDWELEYLLEEADRTLPGIGIDREHVRYGYSGVRALPRGARATATAAVSQRHCVVDHKHEGISNLLSILGGTLAAAERVGDEAARAVRRAIGSPPRSGRLRALPPRSPGRVSFLAPAVQEHLRSRYAQHAADVAAYAAVDQALANPISPFHPEIGAEVAYAVDHEWARTVGDVLFRRMPVGLTQDLGHAAAPEVAAIMGARLGWSEPRRAQAVQEYETELRTRFRFLRARDQTPRAASAATSA